MSLRERRHSQEKQDQIDFPDFFENAPVALHCVRADGCIIWVNQAELDLLGYMRKEYVGHHVAEFHADQKAARDILRRLTRGEILHNHEARLVCKNGTIKQVLISSNSRWERGRFIHTRCFTRDITDRKHAEALLRQIEAKYRAMLESTGEGIYGIDPQGNCTFINQSAACMLGYAPEELVGKSMHELTHYRTADGSPYPAHACPIDRSLRTGIGCRDEGEVLWRRDGTSFPIVYSSSPMRESGIITGAVVTFTDITDRHRTVQALKDSEERFRQLAEHIREVFWMSDADKSQILYISPAYEEIWGRSRKSLYEVPLSWLESIHPDDRERVLSDARRKQTTGDYDVEYRVVRQDGSIRWVHDRAFPIRDRLSYRRHR